MKQVDVKKITDTVARMFKQANCFLPEDVLRSLNKAYKNEENDNAKWVLGHIVENAAIAGQKDIALCQDTGAAEVFIKLGQDVSLVGGTLKEAVNKGVAKAYKEGFMRTSMVKDPVNRVNTGDNTPAQIYLESVAGSTIEITVLPKGGGSENASKLKMLIPSDGIAGIKNFVLETVKEKAVSSCAPIVVGVGVGGTFSTVAGIAKKALLREIGEKNPDAFYNEVEKELLEVINSSNIGPMGLGGKTTALAVHIESAPCHIASLPVAVSMMCHSLRRLTETI